MRASGLWTRLEKLEKAGEKDLFAGVSQVCFGLWCDRLRPDQSIPAGARIVQDFFCTSESEDWGGRVATFRSGYFRERITLDPDDHGRLIRAGDADADESQHLEGI